MTCQVDRLVIPPLVIPPLVIPPLVIPLLLLTIAIFTTSACGDNTITHSITDSCEIDDDCGAGFICRDGACLSDSDEDGIPDDEDNCPDEYNPDQADEDGDGQGDLCDEDVPPNPDRDSDDVLNEDDNCPDTPNTDQADLDGDDIGDVCDPDRDGDDVSNEEDNCPDEYNPGQQDLDGDDIGDVCDPDRDGDDIPNSEDDCPDDEDDACADRDFDSIPDADDNCPDTPNTGQEDRDDDDIGDACDPDRDGDDVLNGEDNCPDTHNPDQTDTDGDDIGDACDPDTTFRDDYPTDEDCEFEPTVGVFSPDIERSYSVREDAPWPNKNQVMSMPLVVNLTDDNGDDLIDENDFPEVVAVTFDVDPDSEWFNLRFGIVRAFDLHNDLLLWTTDPGEVTVNAYNAPFGVLPAGTPAAADIDNDGQIEIVTGAISGGLICFDHEGGLEWGPTGDLDTSAIWWGGPAIADLDHDGDVEIVAANQVYDAEGTLLAIGPSTVGTGENNDSAYAVGSLSAIADVVGDSNLDLIFGNGVLEFHDGALTQAWPNPDVTNEFSDGFPAVADLDGNGTPEIVVSSNGALRVHDGATGAIVWGPVDYRGTDSNVRLGAPTIANFDGEEDSDLEVGVASRDQYLVIDIDLDIPNPTTEESILWGNPTHDHSSSATGSSVFDFDGDGQAEVLYNDEFTLFAYDGATGTPLIEFPNSSFTAVEYPVIADVDNDGNAEIVVVGNDFVMDDVRFNPDSLPAFHGIRIWGSGSDNWVATRRIWNEHTYHITNINEDGSVPLNEVNNWDAFNNYRQNLPNEGDSELAAPDLVTNGGESDDDGESTLISIWVSNQGATAVPAGMAVAFYLGAPSAENLLGVTYTTYRLSPGEGERVSLSIDETCDTGLTITIVADDNGDGSDVGDHRECDDVNNLSLLAFDCE